MIGIRQLTVRSCRTDSMTDYGSIVSRPAQIDLLK
jgi:hypothetical protein